MTKPYEALVGRDSNLGQPSNPNTALVNFVQTEFSNPGKKFPGKDNMTLAANDSPDMQRLQEILKGYMHKGDKTGKPGEKPSGAEFLSDTKYIEDQWKAGAIDPPTQMETESAQAKLKETTSPLIGEQDKAALAKAQEALLNGDPKALASVLGEYKNNPEKLKGLVSELDKGLQETGAGIHITMQGSDVSLMGGTGGGFCDVRINPQTGKATASFGTMGRASFDGSIAKDPELVMKRLGSQAVKRLNGESDK